MSSTNNIITHIAGIGRYGAHSILGGNMRYLDSKYSLDCKQIVSINVVIKVNQIKEIIQMRDRRGGNIQIQMSVVIS